MTYQPPPPMYNPPPTPPLMPAPRKRHHWRNTAFLIGVVLLGMITIAIAAGGTKKAATPIATSAVAVPSTSQAAPAPAEATTSEAPPAVVPSPDGTVTGTCAYELSPDYTNYDVHAGDLNADVEAANTGNIGIVVKVTVTFPQLGHTAITMAKNVKVPNGATVTVHFTRVATGSEIDRLQSWQLGHADSDGCTYKGDVAKTYGAAS